MAEVAKLQLALRRAHAVALVVAVVPVVAELLPLWVAAAGPAHRPMPLP